MSRVLLTGATGSFGRYLARALLADGNEVVAVTRRENGFGSRERLCEEIGVSLDSALTTVEGDLRRPNLGLVGAEAPRRCDVLLHSAASTAFDLPLEAARAANVTGTLHALDLAASLPSLRAVGYVGTTFVAGCRQGRIYEDELRHSAGFVNTYEQSKYEAELAARASELPLTICRPSVIADCGRLGEPSALCFILQLIADGLLPVLPGPADATIDVIAPADAADAVVELLLHGEPGCYHVASGDEAPLVDWLVAGSTSRRVTFLEPEAFGRELVSLGDRFPRLRRVYEALRPAMGVLAHPKTFDTTRAEAELGHPLIRIDPVRLARQMLEEAA